MTVVLLLLIGYLIGSIPSSYLSMRFFRGSDIHKLSTGNATVTAVAVYGGKGAATAAFLGEIIKTVACILIARALVGEYWAGLVILVAAVFGSSWSIWLRGGGGQGQTIMATGLILLSPFSMLIIAACYLLPMAITRKHFLSNQIFHLSIPLVLWLWNGSWEWGIAGCLLELPFFIKQFIRSDDVLQVRKIDDVGHTRAGAV